MIPLLNLSNIHFSTQNCLIKKPKYRESQKVKMVNALAYK